MPGQYTVDVSVPKGVDYDPPLSKPIPEYYPRKVHNPLVEKINTHKHSMLIKILLVISIVLLFLGLMFGLIIPYLKQVK